MTKMKKKMKTKKEEIKVANYLSTYKRNKR